MKYRLSFVTNSSSSSFVCDICGGSESGWDMCLSEAGMYECVNGHTFHEDCGMGNLDRKEVLVDLIKNQIEYYNKSTYYNETDKKKHIEDEEDLLVKILDENFNEEDFEHEDRDLDNLLSDYEFRYNVPSKHCPICSLKSANSSIMLEYLLKTLGFTEEYVLLDMRTKFGNYDNLKVFLGKK